MSRATTMRGAAANRAKAAPRARAVSASSWSGTVPRTSYALTMLERSRTPTNLPGRLRPAGLCFLALVSTVEMSRSRPAWRHDLCSQPWQEVKSTIEPSVSVMVMAVTRRPVQRPQTASSRTGVVTRDTASPGSGVGSAGGGLPSGSSRPRPR